MMVDDGILAYPIECGHSSFNLKLRITSLPTTQKNFIGQTSHPDTKKRGQILIHIPGAWPDPS